MCSFSCSSMCISKNKQTNKKKKQKRETKKKKKEEEEEKIRFKNLYLKPE